MTYTGRNVHATYGDFHFLKRLYDAGKSIFHRGFEPEAKQSIDNEVVRILDQMRLRGEITQKGKIQTLALPA